MKVDADGWRGGGGGAVGHSLGALISAYRRRRGLMHLLPGRCCPCAVILEGGRPACPVISLLPSIAKAQETGGA